MRIVAHIISGDHAQRLVFLHLRIHQKPLGIAIHIAVIFVENRQRAIFTCADANRGCKRIRYQQKVLAIGANMQITVIIAAYDKLFFQN